MTGALARNWWLFVLRGVFAIIFGILAWVNPGGTLQALIWVFAAYSLIDGVTAIISIFSSDEGRSRWFALLLEGLLGIAAAVIAFALPVLTALTIAWVIGAWAVVTGVLRIVTAIRLREEIENEWWMGLGGLVSIIFGVIMFATPVSGLLAVLWVIGIWAIVFGVMLIALGFRLRGRNEALSSGNASA